MSYSAVGTIFFPLVALEMKPCEKCNHQIGIAGYLTVCGHLLCNRCHVNGEHCCDNEECEEEVLRVLLVGIKGMEGDPRSEERASDYCSEKNRKFKFISTEFDEYIKSGNSSLDRLLEEIKERAIEVKKFLSVSVSPATEEGKKVELWIEKASSGLQDRARMLHGQYSHAVSTAYFGIGHWRSSLGRLCDLAEDALLEQKSSILADQAMKILDVLFNAIAGELDDTWYDLNGMRRRFDYTYDFSPLDGKTPASGEASEEGVFRLMGCISMVGEFNEAKRARIE